MQRLFALYRTLNILSVDVCAGALIGALFFAKLCHAVVPLSSLVSLASTVWIIYTVDHLLDVVHLKSDAASARHRYHQRYFRALAGLVFIFIIIDIIMLFFLPAATIRYGMALAFFVLVYGILKSRLSAAKEFVVAALYVLGILVPVISIAEFTRIDLLVALIYFFIAFTNLVLFSLIETESDLKDGHISIATKLGHKITRIILMMLFMLAGIFCCVLFLNTHDIMLSLSLVTMNAVLFIVLLAHRALTVNNWYRILGDAVFLIPVLYILI